MTNLVAGISVVRNEDDIVSMSVLNMLSIGVDYVIILDNSSSDLTFDILRKIEKTNSKVHILRDDAQFNQKKLLQQCIEYARKLQIKWLIPFDADEFWSVDPNFSVHDLLFSSNFERLSMISVVPHQFVIRAKEIEEFRWIDFEKSFWIQHKINSNLMHNRLRKYRKGNCSFLELRQPNKGIFKLDFLVEISAGQHDAVFTKNVQKMNLGSEGSIQLFHLPFRSFANLRNKAKQGERLIEARMPKSQGWQHRLWASMVEEELRSEWKKLYISSDSKSYLRSKKNLLLWDERLQYKLHMLCKRDDFI